MDENIAMQTTSGTAKTDGQEFIEVSRAFLKELVPRLVYCLEQMSEEDIWWRPNEQSNSAGNLVLHLCGNMKQWILAPLGGETLRRDRDAEFTTRQPIPKADLISSLRST